MNHRTLRCDKDELRFDGLGNVFRLALLRVDVKAERPWHWDYQGLVGVLTVPVLRNALEVYDAYIRHRHRRESVPKSVGVFLWGQTVSVDEVQKPLDPDGPAEAASGGEPKQ